MWWTGIHHAFQESRSRSGHYGFYHVSFGEGYYLPDTSQYIVFTYKTVIFTFERGGLWWRLPLDARHSRVYLSGNASFQGGDNPPGSYPPGRSRSADGAGCGLKYVRRNARPTTERPKKITIMLKYLSFMQKENIDPTFQHVINSIRFFG
jgi:hypothetical protein